MRVLPAKSKTEAVTIAISEEIRRRKLEKIKAMAGKMEFDATDEELRHHDDRLG
ncbi:MAG: DUF2191 domain-containing protein [Coprothermobacterota bacterium]|nr:DUF2191 domain-containing protein [Coprothermobacterota bacterium]